MWCRKEDHSDFTDSDDSDGIDSPNVKRQKTWVRASSFAYQRRVFM